MIELSDFGVHNFDAHCAWEEYIIENNINDPFYDLRVLRDEYTTYTPLPDGSTLIVQQDMTEEQKAREKQLKIERDNFIIQRDIWIGDYLLKNFGYNDLIKFAQAQPESETAFQEWFRAIKPCEGHSGQCDMLACPVFNNCPKIVNMKEI